MTPVTVIETTIPTAAPARDRGAMLLDLAGRVADLRHAGLLPVVDAEPTPAGQRILVTVEPERT